MQQYDYDIILVLGFFRRLTYYLGIIKYLGKDFRIGLFPIPLDNNLKDRRKTAQEDFIRICINMGAQLVEKVPVSAKITLFPQEPYTKDAVRYLHENLFCSQKIAVMTLAWAGLHDDFIKEFDIPKVLVIHKAFFEFLLQHRGDPKIFEGRDIVEIGLPYKKYPVFKDFQTDYLLAMPTPFSFPQEKDKWYFLETTLSLFNSISPDDVIVHKPHNALDYDHFSQKKYRKLARFLRVLPDSIVCNILKQLANTIPTRLSAHIARLYTAFLYEKIMDRVIPMEKMTPNHNFAMEAFLPGVKKGVIGGLSNTIWGTLFFKLPFYNCVDIKRQDRQAEKKLYSKDASQLLELNLQFFHVPYCEGRLDFDSKHFDIVDESTRQGDLIEELKKELQSVN